MIISELISLLTEFPQLQSEIMPFSSQLGRKICRLLPENKNLFSSLFCLPIVKSDYIDTSVSEITKINVTVDKAFTAITQTMQSVYLEAVYNPVNLEIAKYDHFFYILYKDIIEFFKIPTRIYKDIIGFQIKQGIFNSMSSGINTISLIMKSLPRQDNQRHMSDIVYQLGTLATKIIYPVNPRKSIFSQPQAFYHFLSLTLTELTYNQTTLNFLCDSYKNTLLSNPKCEIGSAYAVLGRNLNYTTGNRLKGTYPHQY